MRSMTEKSSVGGVPSQGVAHGSLHQEVQADLFGDRVGGSIGDGAGHAGRDAAD